MCDQNTSVVFAWVRCLISWNDRKWPIGALHLWQLTNHKAGNWLLPEMTTTKRERSINIIKKNYWERHHGLRRAGDISVVAESVKWSDILFTCLSLTEVGKIQESFSERVELGAIFGDNWVLLVFSVLYQNSFSSVIYYSLDT